MRYRYRQADELSVSEDNLTKAYQQRHSDQWESLTLALETVTPIYGGGFQAGQPDMLAPLRPRAIRNGIKHWWWLLNRHRFQESKALYVEMGRIWGRASERESSGVEEESVSRIRIGVHCEPDTVKRIAFAPYEVRRKEEGCSLRLCNNHPAVYALFGAKGSPKGAKELAVPSIQEDLGRLFQAQPEIDAENPFGYLTDEWQQHQEQLAAHTHLFKADEQLAQLLKSGITITLTVSISKGLSELDSKQVKNALIAWLLLDGIGSRTSRGLGHLHLQSVTPDDTLKIPNDLEGLAETLGAAVVDGLCGNQGYISPEQAWLSGLECYKEFRQQRRGGQGNTPGISFWPKADVIRAATGKDLNGGHQTRHPGSPAAVTNRGFTTYPRVGDNNNDNWCLPEMFFGAPINVEFKDGGDKHDADPPSVALLPKVGETVLERYHSPLRIVPHWLDGQWYPLALVLKHEADLAEVAIAIRQEKKTITIIPRDRWWPANLVEQRNIFEAPARIDREQNPLRQASEKAAGLAPAQPYDPLAVFLAFWETYGESHGWLPPV